MSIFRKMAALGIVLTACLYADSTNVRTSPVTTFCMGPGVGGVHPLNSAWNDESSNFMKLLVAGDLYFTDAQHLFIDVDWMGPGSNFGMDAGLDYRWTGRRVIPFLGMGVGLRYIDKKERPFNNNIGLSGTAHGGVILDVSRSLQVRFRVPYHVVFNKTRDQGVGVDLSFLISAPFRHIRKYDY